MTEPLSRDQKVERLLNLTGTPEDKRALARSNYEAISDTELDQRVADFEQIESEIQTWRQERRTG